MGWRRGGMDVPLVGESVGGGEDCEEGGGEPARGEGLRDDDIFAAFERIQREVVTFNGSSVWDG